jgi:membrane associated rhomboid family serine protease
MRSDTRFETRWSVTWLVIALNVAVFVMQNMVDQLGAPQVYRDFALSLNGLKHGYAWQLLTFQFLHIPLADGGVFHLLGNLFAIHIFGRALEAAMGPAGFIKLYLLSGTLGGALQMVGALFCPEPFGLAVVGASAGAFGLIAAFATLFPRRILHFFFLPIAVRADVLLAIGVTVTLVGLFLPWNHVAHCAHLGGILTGFLFARQWVRERGTLTINGGLEVKSSLKITLMPD